MDYKVKNCLYQWENKLSHNIFYSLYKSVSQAKKKKKGDGSSHPQQF